MSENNSYQQNSRWHVSREIPMSGLVAILVQTAFFIWWLGSLAGTVNGLVISNAKLEIEVKALAATVIVPTALSVSRIETLNSRVFAMESQLREVAEKLAEVKNEQLRRTPFIPRKPQ